VKKYKANETYSEQYNNYIYFRMILDVLNVGHLRCWSYTTTHIIKKLIFQENLWVVYFLTIETQTIQMSIFMVIGK